jgi:hypothetical protein
VPGLRVERDGLVLRREGEIVLLERDKAAVELGDLEALRWLLAAALPLLIDELRREG